MRTIDKLSVGSVVIFERENPPYARYIVVSNPMESYGTGCVQVIALTNVDRRPIFCFWHPWDAAERIKEIL